MSTIYADKSRTTLVPNTYKKDSICRTHLEIAHIISDLKLPLHTKREILDKLDHAFNFGKRMDAKLAQYRKQYITPEYKKMNAELHQSPKGFGGSGHRWVPQVLALIHQFSPGTFLDYGCGQETLWKGILKERPDIQIKYRGYDPAISGLSQLPDPADLVTCTDVLEHIEPHLLVKVVEHLRDLTNTVLFLNIAIHPANKQLPDGRNAHLTVQRPEWWMSLLWSVFPRNIDDYWHIGIMDSPRPEKDFLVVLWKEK